jgi:hypothetical protein
MTVSSAGPLATASFYLGRDSIPHWQLPRRPFTEQGMELAVHTKKPFTYPEVKLERKEWTNQGGKKNKN